MKKKPAGTTADPPVFLGKRAEALSTVLERQVVPVFERAGIEIPVRSSSVMLSLHEQGSATAADLAQGLGQSHQLVLQKMPTLLERGLVARRPDPADRRRQVFRLTPNGARQVERLVERSTAISEVYQGLYEEIGIDLFDAIGRALDALNARDVSARLEARDGEPSAGAW